MPTGSKCEEVEGSEWKINYSNANRRKQPQVHTKLRINMLNAIEDYLFWEVKLMLKSQGMVAVEEFLNKNNVAVIEAFYPGMEGLRRQLIAAEC